MTPIFMRFGVILVLIRGWSNRGWNMHICRLSWNWVLKVDLGTHLRDKHRHLFLWDLELFFPSFKVGQSKVENMHFCQLFFNWNFNLDLDSKFRDKHGHLFLRDLELFFSLVQGWSNQGWKYALSLTFSELKFESGFSYPFER